MDENKFIKNQQNILKSRLEVNGGNSEKFYWTSQLAIIKNGLLTWETRDECGQPLVGKLAHSLEGPLLLAFAFFFGSVFLLWALMIMPMNPNFMTEKCSLALAISVQLCLGVCFLPMPWPSWCPEVSVLPPKAASEQYASISLNIIS